ncbi:MAG: hypothetical protein JNL50_11820 [Phycisphaerae bacterium]|nr:hypothetical protein [Phycisphaerae bacterium]
MPRVPQRNNMLAGLFLVTGVVLAVVVSFVLSGLGDKLEQRTAYMGICTLADGAAGIKPGSLVLLGGQPVGKVEKVELKPDPDAPGMLAVHVTAGVRAGITLYDDAEFHIERPLLGSSATINISAVGTPGTTPIQGANRVLEAGERVRLTPAPPSFLAQAGFGDEEVKKVQTIIDDAQVAVEKLSRSIDRASPRVEAAIEDVAASVADIRRQLPGWSGRVDATLANAEKASERLDPMLGEAQQGVADARAIIKGVGEDLDRWDPTITSIFDNADAAVAKVNNETVDKFNTTLDDARTALDEFTSAAKSTGALVKEQSPNLRRAMANARLMSDQLKLAAIEIRSKPWRLLYTPSPKESEATVLYDATRAYADAVSDLRAASEALESSMAGAAGGGATVDRATIEELTARLRDAFQEYRGAEEHLMDKLVKTSGPK